MSKSEGKKSRIEADKNARGVQSRRTALEVLMRIQTSGAYSNIALSSALSKSKLSQRDRAFVTLLVQGVTRNLSSLDAIIAKHSKRRVDKLPLILLNTLRLSIFQLEQLPDIPPSAVLDTAATIARICGHRGMSAYTSGVLRSFLRQKDITPDPEAIANREEISVEGLATRYSIPEWLIKRWLNRYGKETTLALLEFSIGQPRISLRVNEQAISIDGLKSILADKGIATTQSELVPSCLVLQSRSKGDPSLYTGYSEGLFSIQDDAAAFVAAVVDARPGETVLDLCAAPGGKTLFMAERMQNKGRVIAVDKQANRLELLKKNRNRLALTNIEIDVADAEQYRLSQLVDRILVDAPCSGTGVLNRKADLRYKLDESRIAALAECQLRILKNAANLLKGGGILVYATCSLEPEENEQVVEKFLETDGQFVLDDLTPFVPARFSNNHCLSDIIKTGMIQLLPTMSQMSGFFVCRMIKQA